MILWRIGSETRKYGADDLSGLGAAIHPGRWNDEKEPVVYAATSIALAVLETAAHIHSAGLPENRFIVEIEVPTVVWNKREVLDLATLPVTWCAIPSGRASVKIGSDWLASQRSPILLVPSVIVHEESAALINPHHPLSKRIKARIVRKFVYTTLFRD